MKNEVAIFVFGLVLGAILCLAFIRIAGLLEPVKVEVIEHMIGE